LKELKEAFTRVRFEGADVLASFSFRRDELLPLIG
jgi:hypothetical protein